MSKYQAQGTVKFVEEDVYNEGCLPETAQAIEFNLRFTADTIEDLFDQIQEFHGVDRDNLLPDSCDEKGRLDVQVMENEYGMTADKNELTAWKNGNRRLFLAEYTYQVSQVTTVSLAG